MAERVIAVYILTNEWHTVLYTGVTADLEKRLAEHRAGFHPNAFSNRYRLHKLVYYETTPDIHAAIAREKQIKAGSRRKKIERIELVNPGWRDLSRTPG
jgi:putative endonuclease